MISVVLPTYNEAGSIYKTVELLRMHDTRNLVKEVIVSDGGSADHTIDEASKAGAKVILSKKGRAAQMNAGAAQATYPVLYFLHADTQPPEHYTRLIEAAVSKGYQAGCFRLRFDVQHWFLQANACFTRFNINVFRFGDQSLFVSKACFTKAGGFNEQLIMLEDQEIIPRLRQFSKFTVINKPVTTSARKYVKNGVYKTQLIYFIVYMLYRLGVSQQQLLRFYKKMIIQDKL